MKNKLNLKKHKRSILCQKKAAENIKKIPCNHVNQILKPQENLNTFSYYSRIEYRFRISLITMKAIRLQLNEQRTQNPWILDNLMCSKMTTISRKEEFCGMVPH